MNNPPSVLDQLDEPDDLDSMGLQTLLTSLDREPSPNRDHAKMTVDVDGTKETFYVPKRKATELKKVFQRNPKLWLFQFGATRVEPQSQRTSRNLRAAIQKAQAAQAKARSTQDSPQPNADRLAYVQSLKSAEGGAWTSAEFTKQSGLSREALRLRRDQFAIVYWTDARGHSAYPKWQFDENLQVLPDVKEILKLLHTDDTLRVLTTFLVPYIGDTGESVLGLIRSGRGTEAVEYVRSIVNER